MAEFRYIVGFYALFRTLWSSGRKDDSLFRGELRFIHFRSYGHSRVSNFANLAKLELIQVFQYYR